ncbi:FkbM family methyltransferase [Xanthobacter sp.]|uniref:FkbM family methyltransferase n=1 Tax=Xanthobacter sp. TaxID=35809 RepID=UPI0025D17E09|nr:FkbM family methyltransferase [Xanthobacter sp.]
MFETLKMVGESQLPRAFAALCPVFDRLAARSPYSEVNFIPLLVKSGDKVCDIGANRGLFIYWLLARGAKVTAFEPNPHMVRILRLRFPEALKSGALRLSDAALSDGPGEATLHIPKGFSPLATIDGRLAAEAGKPMEEVRVSLARLDDVVAGDISFIKLDVEGHELKVLEGATGVLAGSKPSILVEAEERHRPGAIASLRALLEPLGYEGFFRDGGRMAPISSFDPAVHQSVSALKADGSHVAKGKVYINNFFFAARPEAIAALKAWRG